MIYHRLATGSGSELETERVIRRESSPCVWHEIVVYLHISINGLYYPDPGVHWKTSPLKEQLIQKLIGHKNDYSFIHKFKRGKWKKRRKIVRENGKLSMRCVLSEIQITFAYVTINKYIKYIIRHTTSHHISAYNVRLASAYHHSVGRLQLNSVGKGCWVWSFECEA